MGRILKQTGPQILDKRITLQYQTKVPDGYGSFTIVWADACTVWAKKTTHRSDEAIQAMQATGIAVHTIRIRYRRGANSSMRIKEGNKYMAIIGPPIEVDEGGGRHWLDITAKEAS